MLNFKFFFWIASFLAMTRKPTAVRHCEERSNPKTIDFQVNNLLLYIISNTFGCTAQLHRVANCLIATRLPKGIHLNPLESKVLQLAHHQLIFTYSFGEGLG